MKQKKIAYLIDHLKDMGHSDLFVGIQVGLVIAGYKGIDLHDDTCAIITSSEFLNL